MTNRRLNTTFVFVVLLGLIPNLHGQAPSTSPPASAKPKQTAPAIRELTVVDVLAWRSAFVDLLDNDQGLVTARYGAPDKTSEAPNRTELSYSPSAKTKTRPLTFMVTNGKVEHAFINPASYERLDVQKELLVLLLSNAFCFESSGGLSLGLVFAHSRDRTATLSFVIDGGQITFLAANFYNPSSAPYSCDRPGQGRNEQR